MAGSAWHRVIDLLLKKHGKNPLFTAKINQVLRKWPQAPALLFEPHLVAIGRARALRPSMDSHRIEYGQRGLKLALPTSFRDPYLELFLELSGGPAYKGSSLDLLRYPGFIIEKVESPKLFLENMTELGEAQKVYFMNFRLLEIRGVISRIVLES